MATAARFEIGTAMTTVTRPDTALRRAAVRATLAPSVHNTQPWRFLVRQNSLEVYADRTRQLSVLDPTGRQLIISCGCALFNARTSLAAEDVQVSVDRFPVDGKSDLLATLTYASGPSTESADVARLEQFVAHRQTNRRRFIDNEVADEVLEDLEAAAAAEGAELFIVRDPDQRVVVAMLSQHADEIENLNPAYRAELRAWTTDSPDRRDGVPAMAVPHVDGTSRDDVPIRDFDTHGRGYLPADTQSSAAQCLVLLCTRGDTRADWLRAGEALERVLLEVTRHGYSASPLTQITEVPSARAQLRAELDFVGYPHILLRIGRADATPASRRRRLVEVIVEES
jgi:nitroreductase